MQPNYKLLQPIRSRCLFSLSFFFISFLLSFARKSSPGYFLQHIFRHLFMWLSLFVSCWRLSDSIRRNQMRCLTERSQNEITQNTHTHTHSMNKTMFNRWIQHSFLLFIINIMPNCVIWAVGKNNKKLNNKYNNKNQSRAMLQRSKTVNALRVAWLINLIASWLVFDATINILGKYVFDVWLYLYSCGKAICACHLVGKFSTRPNEETKWKKKQQQQQPKTTTVFIGFRATEIVSIVCPKVTHWWCRLFIKLNSLCHDSFFYGCIFERHFFFWFLIGVGEFWCGFEPRDPFVWQKIATQTTPKTFSLINFNTNLVIWFNFCFVCVNVLFVHVFCVCGQRNIIIFNL